MSVIMYNRQLDIRTLVSKANFFLFGPWATGKSSLIRSALPEALCFNLLDDDIYEEFMKRIYYLRTHSGLEIDFVLRNKKGSYLLIELKSSEPDANELKKVLKASEAFPEKHDTFIACIKCEAKKKLGVTILPWQAMMKKIVDWV